MSDQQPTRVFAGGAHFNLKNGKRYVGGLFRKSLDAAFSESPWQSLSAGLPETVEGAYCGMRSGRSR